MYLKPTPGRQVPDPQLGDTLPHEGCEVEATQYWQRRLNDGDVVQTSAPESEPVPTPIATPRHAKEA